jgi:hypothetical protein
MDEYTTRPVSPYFQGKVPPLIDPVAELRAAAAARLAARKANYGKRRQRVHTNFRRLEPNIFQEPPSPHDPRRVLSTNSSNATNQAIAPTTTCLGCVDLPGDLSKDIWLDSSFYDCESYEKNQYCTFFGKDNDNGEGTANDQCCTCGGGNRSGCGGPTTAAPVRIVDDVDFQNYTTLTNIWNTTLNATEVESDQPASVTVETLLYTFTPASPPLCSLSDTLGFSNCTLKSILHGSTGPWTPKRENYSSYGYFNPHYYNTDDVCLHMVSSNTDLVWPQDTRAVALVPAGHQLIITPRPWRFGSTTITVTATAFNRTLGNVLYEDKQRAMANATMDNSTTDSRDTVSTMGVGARGNADATNSSLHSLGATPLDPCELYHLIVAAQQTGNHQTYALARKSFAVRVNQTICYGFVDLFPGTMVVAPFYQWPNKKHRLINPVVFFHLALSLSLPLSFSLRNI